MIGIGLHIVDTRKVASAFSPLPVHPLHEHRNNALAHDASGAVLNLGPGGMGTEEFTNDAFHLFMQGEEVFSRHLVKQAGRAGQFPQADEESFVLGARHPVKKGPDPARQTFFRWCLGTDAAIRRVDFQRLIKNIAPGLEVEGFFVAEVGVNRSALDLARSQISETVASR